MATFKAPKSQKAKPVVKASQDVLIYADFGCTTGFGNVVKELIDNWPIQNSNAQFYIFALNNFEKEPYFYKPNVKVLPANVMPGASSEDLFQRAAFIQLFANVQFNVIYLLNDIEIIGSISGDLHLCNLHKKKKKLLQHKTIFYFPIDSIPRPKDLDFLTRFDEIATFTEYGKQIVQQFAPKEASDKIQVIPHGVNTKDFYKQDDEVIIQHKEKLFGKNKFVIGTVNRNSTRKDIANALLGFAKFYNDWEFAPQFQERLVLYCHCNPIDVAGPNLQFLAKRLGLVEGKNLFFPKKFSENKGISTSQLNDIYNTFDCFITTSTAEGWGLTLTEAMATKTPCIAPMHTSFVEITDSGKNCYALHTEETVFRYDTDKIRYKTSPSEISKVLHIALDLHNLESQNVMVENAYQKVLTYSWEDTANKFWELINKYL